MELLAELVGWIGGTERLEQAVAAYTEALKECTRERVPLDWATTSAPRGILEPETRR